MTCLGGTGVISTHAKPVWTWPVVSQLAEGSRHGSPPCGVDAGHGHSAGGHSLHAGTMGPGQDGFGLWGKKELRVLKAKKLCKTGKLPTLASESHARERDSQTLFFLFSCSSRDNLLLLPFYGSSVLAQSHN